MTYPAGHYQPAVLYLLDAAGRVGSFTVYSQHATAANYDLLTNEWGYFRAAVQAVCLGTICRAKYLHDVAYTVPKPTNGATVKCKLLVTYQSLGNSQRMQVVIPTFNPALPVYISDQTDAIRMNTPQAIANLVTEWRYMCVPPRQPTAGTIAIGLRVVGRNVRR